MMDLVQLMPGLYASSWDILIIQDMIICDLAGENGPVGGIGCY